MKVLFISSMALFPQTRFGGSKRLYYFAQALEKQTDLHLLCFDGSREWKWGSQAPKEFSKQLLLPLAGKRSWWRRAFSSPVDISEEIQIHRASIETFLAGHRFDAALLAYPLSLSMLGV